MIPKRPYGKQGDKLSIIGFGGIVVTNTPQDQANRVAREAYDQGVNYYDVAPSYGNAQEILGPAIEPFRKKIFLACKTEKRAAKDAQIAMEDSFKKLHTDYFDLYQLHGMTSMEEVEQVFAPGGAMEVIVKAKEQGKIKHIGFSAHNEQVALELLKRFPFESVLFPFNFVTLFHGNFGWKLLEEAPKKGVSLLALKAMAKTPWKDGQPHTVEKTWYEPITDAPTAELAVRYTLSLPVTAFLTPGDEKLFRMALPFAHRFKPVSEAEKSKLKKMAMGMEPIFQNS